VGNASGEFKRLVRIFWPKKEKKNGPDNMLLYQKWCRTERKGIYNLLPAKTKRRELCKFERLQTIATSIKANQTREELIKDLETNEFIRALTEQKDRIQATNVVLDLVSRLLVMCHVGTHEEEKSARTSLNWPKGKLRDYIASAFPKKPTSSSPIEASTGIDLGIDFNARNLSEIAGWEVELTNNLLDHLRVDDANGKTVVMIFHHASFLQNLLWQPGQSLFPEGFIQETLQTLALLFPHNRWHRPSVKWYKDAAGAAGGADDAVLDCGKWPRDVNKYDFWHDRLVTLKNTYDYAKNQYQYDQHRYAEWFALWVVVGVTIVFGVVQTVLGVLQLKVSYPPPAGGK